jgi:hypothetical protein
MTKRINNEYFYLPRLVQFEVQLFQILCVQGFESTEEDVIKTLIEECTNLQSKRKIFFDHPLLLNCFLSVGNCIIRLASSPIFNSLIQFAILISNSVDDFFQKLLYPFVQSLDIAELDRQQLLFLFSQNQNAPENMSCFFENVSYLCPVHRPSIIM